MAADSVVMSGQLLLPVAFPKIFRLPDGRLVGASGYCADCWAAFQWFLAGEPEKRPEFIGKDNPDTELDMLLLKPDGSLWRSAKAADGFYPVPDGSAIGLSAGTIVAEVAMQLGKTASEALEMAISMVVGLGGPVQVERLLALAA